MILIGNNRGAVYGNGIIQIREISVQTRDREQHPDHQTIDNIVQDFAENREEKSIRDTIRKYINLVYEHFNPEKIRLKMAPLPIFNIYDYEDKEAQERITGMLAVIKTTTAEELKEYIPNFFKKFHNIETTNQINKIYKDYGLNGLRFVWAYYVAGNHGTEEKTRVLQIKYCFEEVVESQGFKLENTGLDSEIYMKTPPQRPKTLQKDLKVEPSYRKIA